MLGKLCPGGPLAAPVLVTTLLSSAALFAQTAPAPGAPAASTPAPVSPPAAAAPPAAATGTTTVYCLPACRAGYLCVEGKCVSACNPPCAADETCTAAGQCEAKTPPAAAAAPVPIAVNVMMPTAPTTPADPGWATGAGAFGVVAAAGALGLAVGSELTKDEQNPSLPLGIGATTLIAVAGPITAVGAGSARDGGDVKGAQGLRIVGWVAYGLTLVDASVLIGMGANEVEPPDGVIVSVGALGAISLLSFAGDAFFSASEARAKQASTPPATFSVSPTLAWARARDGDALPVLGVRGAF